MTKYFLLLLFLFGSLLSVSSMAFAKGGNPRVRPDVLQRMMNARFPKQEPQTQEPQTDEPAADDTATQPAPIPVEVNPREIRFHMWDGQIIGGELPIDAIDIETEFGSLRIPVNKIVRFFPGLDSMPELQEKIAKLVEDLGDKEFDTRERSHNELVQMGVLLRHEIGKFSDGGSAERKKHLAEIKKKIDEIESDSDELGTARALIRGDYVQTPDFAVVGRIVQKEFALKSAFGQVTIPIGNIKIGDRAFGAVSPEVRKTVDIDTNSFIPASATNTRIRVNRGDKISIRATGDMQWTNWNQSCGPDGMTDKGQFRNMKSGALVARIGEKGDFIQVGSKADFVAKSAGELYLGIAMADNFKQGGGYTWTGKYSAKILVQPQN